MKKTGMFLAGMLVMAIAVGLFGSAAASGAKKTVLADDIHVSVKVDGEVLSPADANGRPVEPLIVDGTTYLPVRSVAEACGYDVEWNQEEMTVELTKKALYTVCYGAFAVPALENILDGSEFVTIQQDSHSVTYLYPVSDLPEGSFIGDYVVILGQYGFELQGSAVEDGIEKTYYTNEFTGVTVSLYYDGGGDYYCVNILTGNVK